MSAKEEFIQIYRDSIRREGADALLDYLEHKSDFFTAPASARGLARRPVRAQRQRLPVPGGLPGAGAGEGALRPGVLG